MPPLETVVDVKLTAGVMEVVQVGVGVGVGDPVGV
jgi:hypothetical protein